MYKIDEFKLDQVQKRATRLIRGMENVPYKRILKEFGMVSLTK